MKSTFIAILTLFVFTSVANAEEPSWQEKLEDYRQEIKGYNMANLHYLGVGWQSSKAAATCSASTLIVGSAFISESLPIFGFIAEGIGSLTNEQYVVFNGDSFLSLETAAELGRGAVGGAAIGVLESMEFVFLWLAGEEQRSYEMVKKVYGGTVASVDALFAEQGQCLMSLSKLMLALDEIEQRETDPRNLYFSEEEISIP